MLTVHKYPVPLTDHFTLQLPEGAKVLSVQEQHGSQCMWCLVREGAPPEPRLFRLAGTGHPIQEVSSEECLYYIGTWQSMEGALVWHLFEVIL